MTSSWKAVWGIDAMTLRDLAGAAALNAVLLVVLVLVWKLVRHRQPMTGARLRRETQAVHTATGQAPFGGDFCRMRAMLSVLEDGIPDERTVTALLLGWMSEGQLTLCKTEKKRLKSFGAAQQVTIRFPSDAETPFPPRGEGAEGMLLRLLQGWTDETAILQESELYHCARQYYSAVHDRLEQLDIQGRHGLRAAGEMMPEKKKRYLGFVDDRRPIYTPRGAREAAALRGYQQWLCAQTVLPQTLWRDAVLCDCAQAVAEEPLMLAQAMARALLGGAKAGKQAGKV